MLNCIDPGLGEAWLEKLFALRFDGTDSCVTLEKLQLIAKSDLRLEKKKIPFFVRGH